MLAFGESLHLGHGAHVALAAAAVVASPLASAIGNVSIKRRGGRLDPVVLNGWAMLGGGTALLAISALTEDWGATAWSAKAVGSIAYLALLGSAFTFVTLTVLLRELPAVRRRSSRCSSRLAPLRSALVHGEKLTAAAVAGAALVAAGIAVAQWPARLTTLRRAMAGERPH